MSEKLTFLVLLFSYVVRLHVCLSKNSSGISQEQVLCHKHLVLENSEGKLDGQLDQMILKNIILDQDGVCEINYLYDSYKLDFSGTAFGKNAFVDYIKGLFPDIKRIKRRFNGSFQVVYKGINLHTKFEPQKPLNFNDITDHLPDSCVLRSCSEESIEIQQDSGCECNGNTVFKVLTIYKQGTFSITISGKKVNLAKLQIDSSYQLNKSSIEIVFAVFMSVRLCCGLRVNKTLIMSRFHTLETWTSAQESFKSLRSLTCYRAVPMSCRKSTCRKCQKQVFTEKNEKEKEKINHEPIEETIKRLFPSAPLKMIEMLIEQAKNLGRNPKGRRWSKEFIDTCHQLYSRSPECYELLRKSQILVLPTPSRLIQYQTSKS